MSSPHRQCHCFASPPLALFFILVFRKNGLFLKCEWKCPQDGECGSRVDKIHSRSTSPPCQNHPVCPLDHACFVFGRSRRCNANFPHRNLLCVWTIVWGGRNMVPTGAWPILILRGMSQPTPNAPEVPRAIGLCLDISNTHIPKNVDICYIPAPQNIRHLGPISPILGPKACLLLRC